MVIHDSDVSLSQEEPLHVGKEVPKAGNRKEPREDQLLGGDAHSCRPDADLPR